MDKETLSETPMDAVCSPEELLGLLRSRRSIRRYTQEPLRDEDLRTILQAGLLYASGRNLHPLELHVVRDKDMLRKMAEARFNGTVALRNAEAAIVVLGDEEQSDLYVEDACVSMANMMLMAKARDVGACWIQGRNRWNSAGVPMEDTLRSMFGWRDSLHLVATLALGYPGEEPAPYEMDSLDYSRIIFENPGC